MTALLEAIDLAKHFAVATGPLGRAKALVRAVDGVSLRVEAGETFAIVGESGCGKSTVARLLLRLIEPTRGTLRLEGRDLAALPDRALRSVRGQLQIVFQDPYGSLNPRMTVGAMLEEPLMLHEVVPQRERGRRVQELLALVGLRTADAQRYPHEFSGGQRQRLAIARALAPAPEIIVCDEPVSALDVSIQAQILNLLADLQRRFGLAYVFISHDLSVVRQVATRIAVMYLGRFVETGAADEVFARPRHPYTRALLDAVPVAIPGARERTAVVGGDVPSPLSPPAGCHFHPRCPHAIDRCRVEVPVVETTTPSDGTVACHRWRELPEASPLVSRRVQNPALARLQAAFEERHA
ncbi:MAG TPA: dipeptide ABC transporter ATP-binding protein [Burkholderiaceae bacterium]|nr:dipeptide ABC transporter ATP-binding protein [Burkholderiaceae bacterium]